MAKTFWDIAFERTIVEMTAPTSTPLKFRKSIGKNAIKTDILKAVENLKNIRDRVFLFRIPRSLTLTPSLTFGTNVRTTKKEREVKIAMKTNANFIPIKSFIIPPKRGPEPIPLRKAKLKVEIVFPSSPLLAT